MKATLLLLLLLCSADCPIFVLQYSNKSGSVSFTIYSCIDLDFESDKLKGFLFRRMLMNTPDAFPEILDEISA